MYGILNYTKLREGILRGAKKYNNTNHFFQGNAGINRGKNIVAIASQELTQEQILMLLLVITTSSSKVLCENITNELIRGNFQFYPLTIRQNLKAITLHSEVFHIKLIIAATNNQSNFYKDEITNHPYIMRLNKVKSLKSITQLIIVKNFSIIKNELTQSILSINKQLEHLITAPNCISKKCLTDMLERNTAQDAESHIQLRQLNHTA